MSTAQGGSGAYEAMVASMALGLPARDSDLDRDNAAVMLDVLLPQVAVLIRTYGERHDTDDPLRAAAAWIADLVERLPTIARPETCSGSRTDMAETSGACEAWERRMDSTPCSIPCCEAGAACATHEPMHDERPPRHHAEAFRQDHPTARWGWQCLTCDAEAFTPTLAAAEEGAERHCAAPGKPDSTAGGEA